MKIKNFFGFLINFINAKPFATLVIAILIFSAGVLIVQAALTLNASSVTSDGSLSLTAGGTNQNITLTPSGTGYSILNGNVGISTTTPAYNFVVNGTSTLGNNNGYLQIENDGTIQLNGSSTVFEDLKFPANALAAGATPADPCLVVGGLRVRCFDGGGTTESMEMIVQMPHDWKIGSTIYPHVHWGPADTGAGNVKWQFEYSWQNTNGAFTTSTIISVTAATDGSAHKNFITFFPAITNSAGDLSSILLGRIFRVPTGDDTYAGDAELYEFDVHYEIDSLGSRGETAK